MIYVSAPAECIFIGYFPFGAFLYYPSDILRYFLFGKVLRV